MGDIKQAQAEAQSQITALQKDLSASTGLQIQLEIDWTFTKSPAFLGQDPGEQKDIIRYLATKHAPNIASSSESESLVKKCEASSEFKQLLKDNVKKVVITYDASSSVSDPVGSWGFFWTIVLNGASKQLLVQINLDKCYNGLEGAVFDKLDAAFKANTPEEQPEREVEPAPVEQPVVEDRKPPGRPDPRVEQQRKPPVQGFRSKPSPATPQQPQQPKVAPQGFRSKPPPSTPQQQAKIAPPQIQPTIPKGRLPTPQPVVQPPQQREGVKPSSHPAQKQQEDNPRNQLPPRGKGPAAVQHPQKTEKEEEQGEEERPMVRGKGKPGGSSDFGGVSKQNLGRTLGAKFIEVLESSFPYATRLEGYVDDAVEENPQLKDAIIKEALQYSDEMAVGKGNMLVVELLLGTYHDNVESRTDSQKTPLLIACDKSNFEMAKLLVDKYHANVRAVDEYNRGALCWAAMGCNLDLVKWLINTHRCDVNARDSLGYSILHWASSSFQEEGLAMVQFLVETCKLDINATNQDGDKPRNLAAEGSEIADYLDGLMGVEVVPREREEDDSASYQSAGSSSSGRSSSSSSSSSSSKDANYEARMKKYESQLKEYNSKKDVKCSGCKGSGKKQCTTCKGSGKSANGKANCGHCKGHRTHDCAECWATGKKYRDLKPPTKPQGR